MSEFGRGYSTCLLMFSFHEPRLYEYLDQYATIRATDPDHANLFTQGHAIDIWMNGASDHLAELIRPRRGITKKQWQEAKDLRDRAMSIRWSWGRSDASVDEIRMLIMRARRLAAPATTYDEAWALDQARGLKIDHEGWICTEALPRRTI